MVLLPELGKLQGGGLQKTSSVWPLEFVMLLKKRILGHIKAEAKKVY
jgi:hypothetical protein